MPGIGLEQLCVGDGRHGGFDLGAGIEPLQRRALPVDHEIDALVGLAHVTASPARLYDPGFGRARGGVLLP